MMPLGRNSKFELSFPSFLNMSGERDGQRNSSARDKTRKLEGEDVVKEKELEEDEDEQVLI